MKRLGHLDTMLSQWPPCDCELWFVPACLLAGDLMFKRQAFLNIDKGAGMSGIGRKWMSLGGERLVARFKKT